MEILLWSEQKLSKAFSYWKNPFYKAILLIQSKQIFVAYWWPD